MTTTLNELNDLAAGLTSLTGFVHKVAPFGSGVFELHYEKPTAAGGIKNIVIATRKMKGLAKFMEAYRSRVSHLQEKAAFYKAGVHHQMAKKILQPAKDYAEIVIWQCHACNAVFPIYKDRKPNYCPNCGRGAKTNMTWEAIQLKKLDHGCYGHPCSLCDAAKPS